MADAPIQGPGAGKPKKPKPPSVREKQAAIIERIERAHASPAIAIEQSVAEAARALEITHERILGGLLRVAEHSLSDSARVSALKELGAIIGTTKPATGDQHLHLHHHLQQVSDDTLAARMQRLMEGIA